MFYDLLLRIKKDTHLISLDIPKLLWLYGNSKDASSYLEGKNIILLLGKTGAGKSTFVHFLGGSKLGNI